MKITSTKFLAAIFLFTLAIAPLRALASAPAEIKTNNIMVAQTMTNGAPAPNAVAAAKTEVQKPSEESSPVRIDETGIHIGGLSPEHNHKAAFGEDALGVMALLIPIFATVSPFVMVIAIIAIIFYFKHRRDKMVNETMRALIEKGVPITPELIAQLRNKPSRCSNQLVQQPGQSRHRRLLPGLILAGIGTAFLISHGHHSNVGWIVLFIGVAFLIVWFVERRDKNNDQPPKQ
jgi:Flp pilus assembly protein TadB